MIHHCCCDVWQKPSPLPSTWNRWEMELKPKGFSAYWLYVSFTGNSLQNLINCSWIGREGSGTCRPRSANVQCQNKNLWTVNQDLFNWLRTACCAQVPCTNTVRGKTRTAHSLCWVLNFGGGLNKNERQMRQLLLLLHVNILVLKEPSAL